MFNCTHMYVLCFVNVLYYSLVYVNLFPTDWIYFTCNTDFCYCTFFVHLIHAKILCIVHLFRIIYVSMFLIILQNKMEKCFYSFEITYRKSSQGGGGGELALPASGKTISSVYTSRSTHCIEVTYTMTSIFYQTTHNHNNIMSCFKR